MPSLEQPVGPLDLYYHGFISRSPQPTSLMLLQILTTEPSEYTPCTHICLSVWFGCESRLSSTKFLCRKACWVGWSLEEEDRHESEANLNDTQDPISVIITNTRDPGPVLKDHYHIVSHFPTAFSRVVLALHCSPCPWNSEETTNIQSLLLWILVLST